MDLIWTGEEFIFAGPDSTAATVDLGHGPTTWGFQLAPGFANAMLALPVSELRDQRLDLKELVRIPEAIWDQAFHDPALALSTLARTLLTQSSPNLEVIRLAVSIDRSARAGVSVEGIADEHYVSVRKLRRLSHEVFGYGPKTLTAIHRLQSALRQIEAGSLFGHAAASSGYSDQAHLSREAKRLTGSTLTDLTRTSRSLA